MAKKFLTSIDLVQNELLNARLQNLAAAPASPVPGQVYYNTVQNTSFEWNGTAWIPWNAALLAAGSIPLSALAVDVLDRANHTGTQTAATISDFETTVKSYPLDTLGAPTAALDLNGQVINNLGAPVLDGDAANKLYVDNAVQQAAAGLDAKQSVRLIETSNVALTGLQVHDSVTAVAGDRILLTGQTDPSENGVWVASAGAWVRATDEDETGEITPGAFWYVEEGTLLGATQWIVNNTGTITVDTDPITINQFGAASVYTAGDGLQLIGSEFSVLLDTDSGLLSTATGLAIDYSVVPRIQRFTVGDGVATTFTLTHNLNTLDVITQVRCVSAGNSEAEVDVVAATLNTTTISVTNAPATNDLVITLIG